MNRCYKYRLYPTADQVARLDDLLRRLRSLYNAALQQRADAWRKITVAHADSKGRRKGASVSYNDQCAGLTELRRAMPEWQETSVSMARDALRRVDLAFKAFFRRCAAGQTPGYPRYQGRYRYNTLTTENGNGGKILNEGHRVRVAGVGDVSVRLHRPYEGECTQIKITRDGDQWHVVFVCRSVPAHSLPPTGAEVGVDLGIANFAALSDGRMVENPRLGEQAAKAIARAARTVARRKKGSKGRREAVERLRKLYAKVTRQRADFHHKAALDLLREHDRIAVEDLKPGQMSRSAKGTAEEPGVNVRQKAGLNRSIMDAGWGNFLSTLESKAEATGRTVVRVDPRYTSQTCPRCGHVAAENRPSQAVFRCVTCGYEAHADTVGAQNVLRLGRSRWGGQPEVRAPDDPGSPARVPSQYLTGGS